MKKITYLLIGILCLTSCSSNDDDVSDPIIGKWKIKSGTVNNISILNACSSQTSIEFKSDNTVNVVSFSDDNANSNCTSELQTGNWKLNNGSSYATTLDSNNGSFIDANIIFSDNNNTFTTGPSSNVVLIYTKI